MRFERGRSQGQAIAAFFPLEFKLNTRLSRVLNVFLSFVYMYPSIVIDASHPRVRRKDRNDCRPVPPCNLASRKRGLVFWNVTKS